MWPTTWEEIKNSGSVTPCRGSQGLLIWKFLFASFDAVGAYWSAVGSYFTTFEPPWSSPRPWLWGKFTLVHHSSTSIHIPDFIKSRRKKCGRTDIESGFIRSRDDPKRTKTRMIGSGVGNLQHASTYMKVFDSCHLWRNSNVNISD